MVNQERMKRMQEENSGPHIDREVIRKVPAARNWNVNKTIDELVDMLNACQSEKCNLSLQ